jgi:hypothetical protein
MKNKKSSPVGRGWWRRFLEDHPTLSIRKQSVLPQERSYAEKWEVLVHFLDPKHEFAPSNIWNMDETGIEVSADKASVIGVRGKKQPKQVGTEHMQHVTMVPTINAAGECIYLHWRCKELLRSI